VQLSRGSEDTEVNVRDTNIPIDGIEPSSLLHEKFPVDCMITGELFNRAEDRNEPE
jgi:hypothetical protein